MSVTAGRFFETLRLCAVLKWKVEVKNLDVRPTDGDYTTPPHALSGWSCGLGAAGCTHGTAPTSELTAFQGSVTVHEPHTLHATTRDPGCRMTAITDLLLRLWF